MNSKPSSTPARTKPAEAELELRQILWLRDPNTAREVHGVASGSEIFSKKAFGGTYGRLVVAALSEKM